MIKSIMLLSGFTLMVIILITSCMTEFVCKDVLISKVGGCNKDGFCGVMYNNGEDGHEYTPVEGGQAKICSRKK